VTRVRFILAALLLALVAGAAFAIDYPALTGRVVDAANIISPAVRTTIESKLQALENQSGIQLVVATVPSLQDNDIETYANGLFRAWKLGEVKRNNGALLVVAPNERKVRVEVGYGLEGTVTDALSSVIIHSAILPRFKAGDFAGGIDRGVDALISAMSDDKSEWHKKTQVRRDDNDASDQFMVTLLVFALWIFIVYVMTRNARRAGARGGSVFIPGGTWTSGGSSGSSWGGGSSGGGFSDGGGFSGGGGSSGGGGASGSW
jgi:uncharacterized protein